MQFLVLMHFACDKDLLTAIHHGDFADDPPAITYVDGKSLFEAAQRAHNSYHTSAFVRYRMVVIPLQKSSTTGVMEFMVDPPDSGAVIKPVSSRRKSTKR